MGSRQRHDEARAAPGTIFDGDRAVMAGDDALADCEPESESAAGGAIGVAVNAACKWLEDPRALVDGDARAAILDDDARTSLDANDDGLPRGRVIDCVAQQVVE